jgi:hypothetical protein
MEENKSLYIGNKVLEQDSCTLNPTAFIWQLASQIGEDTGNSNIPDHFICFRDKEI